MIPIYKSPKMGSLAVSKLIFKSKELFYLRDGGNEMFEKKFAVTKTVGNNEKILKYFGEDEKAAALAYGAEVAKENTDGVISCILTRFDENGNKKDGECEVFEVWN